MQISLARHPLAALVVSVLSTTAYAQSATEPPVKTLNPVNVTGPRPTALPAHIPTTIEGVTGAEVEETINATDAEDALKYFPSLLVRKRNIGDYDHAVLSSRASGTGNSARSLVYVDGILISNLLGNGAGFTPRWALVTPEEIARVDVLYGPFSAAFPGNSAGAVVDYITRMPQRLEAHVKYGAFAQHHRLYATDQTYAGNQWSASLGDRHGRFAWWFNLNRLDSDAQPLTFATKLIATGVAGGGGVPVTGAVTGQNPRNQAQWILGAGTETRTTQDHGKLKLAFDVAADMRASYVFGLWRNDAFRGARTFLRDANGNPVYSGTIAIDGRAYTVAPTELSASRADLEHRMHGLSLRKEARRDWDWEIAASRYDYHRDAVRTPTVALPAALQGGAGRIADQAGTGWNTLALKLTWRASDGAHLVDAGVQRDRYRLRTRVDNAADWLAGAPQSRFSAFQGDTELASLYAQDTWRFARDWRATLGARMEWWQADDGAIASGDTVRRFADRRERAFSPKAALAWQANSRWQLRASLGRAVRNPTVSELYQGSLVADTIVNNDPGLRAEKSWTGELTAERDLGTGSWRATLFAETTRDALYSQTNVTVVPNVTSIQNVDRIHTRGMELAWRMSDWLAGGLDVAASATFASSIIERNDKFPASVGKWQPRVPRWRATMLASYRWNGAWSSTLGVRYGGRQFSQLDNSDANGMAYTGASAFLVADARLRYRLTRQWSAAVGVDNLGNREYWNFHPYPGRTWMGEARFDF